MTSKWLYLTSAFVVISSGCSTAVPPTEGNPFDEPRADPLVQAIQEIPARPLPTVRSRQLSSSMPVRFETLPLPTIEPTEDGPAIMFVGVAPSTNKIESHVESHGESEIMVEARKVANAGDVNAQLELLNIAGHRGDPVAFYELARVYQNGVGVSKSTETAVGYLTRALGMGHVESARVLGWLYVFGSGVDEDVDYGRQLLSQAAQTSTRAQREYGMALANLRSPNFDDVAQGETLLRQAAAAGDTDAATALAQLSEPSGGDSGSLVAAEPSPESQSAPKLGIEERARAGDLEAMYAYAVAVSIGKLPAKDPQFTAYCWHAAAAARGHAQAAGEVRSLSGVRKIADRAEPGKTDRCIAEVNALVDGANQQASWN